ncbi:hypothetical protein IIA16_05815, partial [bacterium]|nr:hypothetical protein [bacterium]
MASLGTFVREAERSPHSGAAKLKSMLTPIPIGGLTDSAGSSVFWRRDIVWLCERLACFRRAFWDCEEILYRLAQEETEERTGNNSQGVWSNLFLPIFSYSSIPFKDRFKKYLERLATPSGELLEFLVKTGLNLLGTHISRIAPPETVGGNPIDEDWRPATNADFAALRVSAAREFVYTVANLPDSLRHGARLLLQDNLYLLASMGCTVELEDLFA